MDQTERKTLGDTFDKQIRALEGRPDVVNTKASTLLSLESIGELTQTYIVQTYRVREEGDTIFIQFIGAEGSWRIALPPVVAKTIAAQYDALTGKNRSKAAKQEATRRKQLGIKPGFTKK